jgi:cytochrome P450
VLDSFAPRAALFARLVGGGDPALDDGEARSLIRLLWLAATVTTERLITHAVLELAERPDLQAQVAADRALVPRFLEEVLRLHPPELMVPRLTRQPVTLDGVTIPEGALVYLSIAAANRDPARFEAPDELRLDRPPGRQFAFGGGIHHCVGAPLGRAIAAVAVGALLDCGKLELGEPLADVPMFTSVTAHCPVRLPILVAAAHDRDEAWR